MRRGNDLDSVFSNLDDRNRIRSDICDQRVCQKRKDGASCSGFGCEAGKARENVDTTFAGHTWDPRRDPLAVKRNGPTVVARDHRNVCAPIP